MNLKKHLFITDMDGTLLSTDSRVTPESAHIISELSRRGALITVATARTPATVEPLLRNTLTLPPAIVLTGATLWDRHTKRFIESKLMSDSLARHVTALCRNRHLNPMTYTLRADMGCIDMFVYGTLSRKEQKFIDERSHLDFKHIVTLPCDQAPELHPRTILIFCLGPTEEIYAVAEELRSGSDASISAYPDIFNPGIALLEVFAPGVSKASAVNRLKQLMQADSVTVYGDNLNDLPMMTVADEAVAVANAMPQVKEAAHRIIGPNSTDAVAHDIESQLL